MSLIEFYPDSVKSHFFVALNSLFLNELDTLIASEVGFTGSLEFGTTKPDGTPRKLMDTTKLTNFGWKPSIKLEEGIRKTIKEVELHF